MIAKGFKAFTIVLLIFLSACYTTPENDYVKVDDSEVILRGQEIVQGLGACGACHGLKPDPASPLAGGREFEDRYGDVKAANLTPSKSGIGHWKFKDFLNAFRKDIGDDELMLSAKFHIGQKWMADEDLLAVFSYLMSVQPVKNKIDRREIGFFDRNTLGLMETRTELSGYVPPLKKENKIQYGRYLVDNVANCGRCHNKEGSFFTDSEYLGGGQIIKVDEEEKYAPSLTPYDLEGIGSWTQKQIISYLLSSRTPHSTATDSRFCPTNFYRLASEEDLEAIAAFLKSS